MITGNTIHSLSLAVESQSRLKGVALQGVAELS